MKHELEIPEGYEVISSRVNDWQTLDEGEKVIVTVLKKQTVKDFDYFVDQYLGVSPSTCESIDNWIHTSHLMLLQDRLKTKQFSLVPWEIKIGLFKFICDDRDKLWGEELFPSEFISEDNRPELLRELIKEIKQNKN